MKQTNLLTKLLLLCLFVVGSVNVAWADGTAIANLNFNSPSTLPSYYTYSSTNTPDIVGSVDSKNVVNITSGGNSSAPTFSNDNSTAPTGGKRWMAFRPAVDCTVTFKVRSTNSSRVIYLWDKDHKTTESTVSSFTITTKNTWYDSWSVDLKGGTWYVLGGSGSSCYITSMQFEADTTPSLSIDPSTEQSFSYIYGNGPSTAKTFTVSLKNSSKAVTASLTGDYEMSKTGDSYDDADIDDLADESTLYVRLKAGLDISADYSGTLTFSNDDVDDPVEITLSGSVVNQIYTISYTANGGSGTMSANEVAEGSNQTLTTNTFTRDCYSFAGWKADVDVTINSETVTAGTLIADGATIQNVTSNIALTAQWTGAYADGASYTFEGNNALGIAPYRATCGTGTDVDFRIDNIFFNGGKYEYDNDGSGGTGDGNNFNGWKMKSATTGFKFLVEEDQLVTIGLGSIGSGGSANITYTNTSGVVQNAVALSAGTNNVFVVKGGTIVTVARNNGTQTVTLKKIIIRDAVSELSSVKINGSAISDDNLSTLNEDKALTIDGSGYNGIGTIEVAVTIGDAPTITRSFDGDDVEFTFTYNEEDYSITLEDVAKTYSENGSVVYYSKNGTGATGTLTNTLTANGITFTMATDASKTFQSGAGNVTLGSDKYVSLKLSTGSAVAVTFPTGKKAKKITVYGWSQDGLTGYLKTIKETSSSTGKKVIRNNDTSTSEKFYATNASTSTYPSKYVYDLKDYDYLWTSLYFDAAGSQPFVVMDFEFADAPVITTQPASAVYKKGDTPTALSVVAVSSDDDPVSYQWFSCDDNGANPVELTGEDEASYTPSIASAGAFYYFCRVTDGNGSTDTDLAAVRVNAAPISSTQFTMTITYSGSEVSISHNSSVDLGDYGTATGGTVKIGNKHTTDDGKAKITSTGSGTVYFGGNDGYIKISLSEALKTGDVISFVPGSGTKQVSFTTDDTRATTYSSSSNTFTCPAAFNGKSTLYVWRKESSATYLHSLTITRAASATVTTNGGNWASFTPSWNCTLSNGATAYIITNIDKENSKVTAKRVEVLEVGKGYFIKGETASTPYTATATTAEATSTEGNLIVGCLSAKDIDGNGNTKYVLGTKDGTAGLYNVNSSITIPAGKSYLDAGEVLSARALTLSFDDEEGETTGIKAIENEQLTIDSYYDLSGRKVAQPTKGLYIVNGKKVVIK